MDMPQMPPRESRVALQSMAGFRWSFTDAYVVGTLGCLLDVMDSS